MSKNPSVDSRLSKKYAKALLRACDSKDEKTLVSQDMTALGSFLVEEGSVLKRVSSPYVPDEVFSNILGVLASEFKLHPKTVSFFKTLHENNRTNLISKSIESFIKQFQEESGVIVVKLISDRDFKKPELQEISDIISSVYKKEVIFEIVRDQNIVAGFLLKINDSITIDCTVNKYLENLRSGLESQLVHIE